MTGCATLERSIAPQSGSASRKRFVNVDDTEVFTAAEQAMREEFHLDVRDSGRGYLKSVAKHSEARRGTGLLSEGVGVAPPSRVRRVAQMWVVPDETSATVLCKVTLERRDTSRRQAFTRDHDVDDVPSGTPSDLDSDTGTPREEWTTIGSDGEMERQLLASLTERLIETAPAPR